MSERSRTQDILVDIVGMQTNINTVLGAINTLLGGGGGGITALVNLVGKQVARVIFVYSIAPAGGDGLTFETAFRTVQEGLDLAGNTNETDLILIFDDPGGDGYDINRNDADSTWTHNNVVMIGIGRQQVRIVNTFVGANHVLRFSTSAVYMYNILLWNGDELIGQNLLYLDRADGCEIYNCDFYLLNALDGSYSIVIEDSQRNVVERCHYHFMDKDDEPVGTTNGILIINSYQNEVHECIFDGAHPSVPGGIGITVESGRGNVFKENTFLENTIGIYCEQGSENNLSCRNIFANCLADFTDDNAPENWHICPCTNIIV